MPVLTNAQVATLQRVLAITNNVLPRLEMLESLANINTAMRPRVHELRTQREYLAQLATAALEIERQLGGTVSVPPIATSGGVTYSPPTSYSPPYSPPPPPPPPMTYSGIVSEPEKWTPSANVAPGTRVLVERWTQPGYHRLPTQNEQMLATNYEWSLEGVHGEGLYATKR